MTNITLTTMISQLSDWVQNANSDINSEWINNKDRELMMQQLQNLLISKANLENIIIGGGQIFSSSIEQ